MGYPVTVKLRAGAVEEVEIRVDVVRDIRGRTVTTNSKAVTLAVISNSKAATLAGTNSSREAILATISCSRVAMVTITIGINRTLETRISTPPSTITSVTTRVMAAAICAIW